MRIQAPGRIPPGRIKVWITAVRPFAYPASVLAVLLGLALAVHAGHPPRWGLFAMTLLGVLLFHTAANLLNDGVDHRRGLDRDVLPTSGAVVRGWLTEAQVLWAAGGCLAGGVACGLVLAWQTGWFVLVLGAMGVLLTLGYSAGRYGLKYHGLGDLAIFAAFGVLPVVGAYWVQTRQLAWPPLFWSVVACSHTVAILHANNWRDMARDRTAGYRTPAVRLGPHGSARYYRLLILAPYLLSLAAVGLARTDPRLGRTPLTVALVLLSLPAALRLARVHPERDTALFEMLDGKTARLHMAFGALLVVGFLLNKTEMSP